MKKVFTIIFITLLVMAGLCGLGYYYQDEIYIYYQEEILKVKDNITISKNDYYKDNNYEYVQNTNDFIAKDKTHLKNIFYTIINSGTENFTFYCGDNYTNCTNDIDEMVKDQELLSNINNFVHPFNSFESISTSYDEFGKVVVKIDKVYSETEIAATNEVVDKIISSEITNNMSTTKKITTIHDYIINNGKYATDSIRKANPNQSFNKALDILAGGYGLCSSYADAMALFLYRFDLDNYKIASQSHIWNLVKINNKWLHLDLTWDDPVTSTGEDKLDDYFLLIDNNELNELQVEQHDFDKDIYKEALN